LELDGLPNFRIGGILVSGTPSTALGACAVEASGAAA
jgi:hypothetical protein